MRKALARKKTPSINDSFSLRGSLEYALRNAFTGEVVRQGKANNVVTFKGRGWVIDKLVNTTDTSAISSLAIGSSSSATNSSQTAMVGYATIKAIGTTARTTSTDAAPVMSFAASFASNETWTNSSQIGEFALYNSNATASGTMFNRVVTATYINFATSNTLAITMSISN